MRTPSASTVWGIMIYDSQSLCDRKSNIVYILRVYSANYTLPTPRRECHPSGGYDIQYSFNLRGGVACLPGVINTSNSTLYITLPLAADSAQGTKDERYSVALPPALLLSP